MLAHVSLLHYKIALTTKNSTRKNQGSVPGLLYHTQDTCHGYSPWWCRTPLDRGLDILMEDLEHANLNNDSTHSLDAMIVLGAPETVGHPED